MRSRPFAWLVPIALLTSCRQPMAHITHMVSPYDDQCVASVRSTQDRGKQCDWPVLSKARIAGATRIASFAESTFEHPERLGPSCASHVLL